MIDHILSILGNRIVAALGDTALLLIFCNAYLSHAPETLPTFRGFPQWLWTWNVAALRAFVSSKAPGLTASHSEVISSPNSNTTTTDVATATIPNDQKDTIK